MARSEFISALLVTGQKAEWTTLRRRKDGFETTEQKAVDIPVSEGAEPGTPVDAASLRAACAGLKGDVTIGLITHQCLLRVADLPSVEPEEIAGMVELQVDKFSPFPVEHMAVAYERVGGSATSSRVLIAAAKLDVVNERAELFKQAGLLPHRMDVAALGWWHLIREAQGVPAKGRHAILLLDDTGSELMITQDGLPVVLRALDGPRHATDEEFAAEIAEEVAYTLTSLETEWGSVAVPDATIWHRGGKPEEVATRLARLCEVTVSTRSLDELPPLSEGLARRAAMETGALDLLPMTWHDAEQRHINQKRLIVGLAAVAALWVLGMGLLFGLTHLEAKRIAAVRADIQAIEKPAEAVRELRGRVENLEQYADRTYSALETLREVSALLPNGMELLSFTYRKGRAINLRGEARDVNLIFDFVEAMEKSPLFTEVKPEGITEAPGGRRRPEFRLTAQLPGDGS